MNIGICRYIIIVLSIILKRSFTIFSLEKNPSRMAIALSGMIFWENANRNLNILFTILLNSYSICFKMLALQSNIQ